jgi:hypothetical protein
VGIFPLFILCFACFLGLYFAFWLLYRLCFFPNSPPLMPPLMPPQHILGQKTMPLKLGAQKTFKCFANIGIYCNGNLTFKPYFKWIFASNFYLLLTRIVQFDLS